MNPNDEQNELDAPTQLPQDDQPQIPQEAADTQPDAQMDTMESLLAEQELSLDLPKPGEVKDGEIVSVSDNEVLVSIGAKSEGIIPGKELQQLGEEERARVVLGAKVKVLVVTPEDSQGNLILSLSRAFEEEDWDKANEVKEKNEMYEGTVVGYNKGGLIVKFARLRGFVPASQISPARRAQLGAGSPDQRWNKMVNDKILVRIMEVDRERRRLIMSEMAALQEAREIYKERLLDSIEEGNVIRGRVTSLAQFGAFVNINGADGLVHLTEVSWDRIKHPGDVLKIGQEVDVKVISVDRDSKRIGLSIRQTQDDPWPQRAGAFQEGQLVQGKIVRLTKFGAFAQLDNDVEGLIHISELSEKRIEHPKEVVQEGDVLTLRVINIDIPQRRIGLSLRKVHSQSYADLDLRRTLEESGMQSTEEESDKAE